MINAAIVGLGRWGQNLVGSVQGVSQTIRFVAGVVRHPERVRDYAEQQGLVLYDDLSTALSDPNIDAVVLATPHATHAEQIVAAAKAGKHVFTEKPFTLTRSEAARALRSSAANKVTLAVGYNWRFQPALQEIHAMLHDGRLGKLLHIEGNFCGPSAYRYAKEHWRQDRHEGPAGGMTGRGVHVVDAMLYLAGRVESVYAHSARLAQGFGLDDTTSMLFRFRSGVTGCLSTVIATAESWRMQIFGSKGWAEVGDVEHLTTWQMRLCHVDPENLLVHHRPQIVSFPEVSTERAELEHFAGAAARGEPLAVSGGDEEHGVAVFEAMLRSIETRRPVALGPVARAPVGKTGSAKAKSAVRGRGTRKKTAKKAPRAVTKTAKRRTARGRSKSGARRSGRR